ncbi:MAG: hydantoinase B/oxoprolinase family protein [Pseudomonadota bacterium]
MSETLEYVETQIADMKAAVDPVLLEVIRAGLTSIVHEMSITMDRTSYSTIIREVHDYSCVLCDGRGRLIAQAEGIPIFNGSMNFVIEAVTQRFPLEDMRPGDLFITNDPYTGGGTHKNDINIVAPIFWQDELVMLGASKAHHLDIGGKDPGSWSSDARNTYQEGLSIPAMRLASGGVINEAITDLLFANMRVPQLSRGDFASQIAAVKTAELRAHAFLDKHGIALFHQAVEELLDHGERITRAAIQEIPDGTYHASGNADADGVTDDPIHIEVCVKVEGSDIWIDFAGSEDQRSGAAGNCHWVNTVSCTREFMMFLTDTALGGNEGSYRPIHVEAPIGSVFRPQYPAPVTTGMGDMGTRLIELLFQALADVLPAKVIAGTFGNFSCMTLSGFDQSSGEQYVHFSPYAGGWGGRAGADGNSAMVSLGSGDNYNIPCEVMETKFPNLLAERFELRERSAGAGQYRGGWGIVYDYRLLSDGEFTIALDRDKFPPYGLFGGEQGQGSSLVVGPGSDSERAFHRVSGVPVNTNTLLRHQTAGGGGYGDPMQREVGAVLEDVLDEFITIDDARNLYGVVIDPDSLEVDLGATNKCRD